MKKITRLLLLLLLVIMAGCKKDKEHNSDINCANNFSYLKNGAVAVYDYEELLAETFDKLTVKYTEISSGVFKVEKAYTGKGSLTRTTYITACNGKIYEAQKSDMSDPALIIDLTLPLNTVFETTRYTEDGQKVEDYYRVTEKDVTIEVNDKTYKCHKIENVVFVIDEYMPIGVEYFNETVGPVSSEMLTQAYEIVSYN